MQYETHLCSCKNMDMVMEIVRVSVSELCYISWNASVVDIFKLVPQKHARSVG